MMRLQSIIILGALISVPYLGFAEPVKALLSSRSEEFKSKAPTEYQNQEVLKEMITACVSSHADQLLLYDRSASMALSKEQAFDSASFVKNEFPGSMGFEAVDYVMQFSLLRAGGDQQLQLSLMHLLTGEQKAVETVRIQNITDSENICEGVKRFADQLQDLKVARDAEGLSAEELQEEQLMLEGALYYHQGVFSKSLSSYLKVARKNPMHERAHYGLIQNYFQLDLSELAALEVEKFKKKFPESQYLKMLENRKGESS